MACWSAVSQAYDLTEFKPRDRQFLASLSLSKLTLSKLNAGNAYAHDLGAALLGKKLFFDTDLSANGEVACASCHQPHRYFTDGLPVSVGLRATARNAPSVVFAGFSPWQFWDGRKDSLWSQALGPLENPSEHGVSREQVAAVIRSKYAVPYAQVFGRDPHRIAATRVFVDAGKALMAYQLKLEVKPSRFDEFVDALGKGLDDEAREVFSEREVSGLKVFVGKGNCISCHNGPLLTNFEFHNVGVPEVDKSDVDLGRFLGVQELAADPFTCLSKYSDRDKTDCLEMAFLKTTGPELVGAFKTPSLRNVAKTAPYMHSGQFATLAEVVDHYNKPKPPFYDRQQHPSRPHFDILPLGLTDEEKTSLVAFLETLTSPLPRDDPWWGTNQVAKKSLLE